MNPILIFLNKNPRPFRDGDYPRYHPVCPLSRTTQAAITGIPGADYFFTSTACSNEQQASSVVLCSVTHYQDFTIALDLLPDDILLLFWLSVDPERFELSTFSMPLRRAPNCAMGPIIFFTALQWTWRDSNPRPLQCD